jgi:hypothetical protein
MIDFPFPEKEYRQRIWESHFPSEAPLGRDISIPELADRYPLAGGNIRNAALAAAYLDPVASVTTRETINIVTLAFNQYAGLGIGEHLGYLFTAFWGLLVGLAMLSSAIFPKWLGWIGMLSSLGILAGVMEPAV